jgi:hypothetical protein
MEAPSYEIKELAWKECCEVWKALAITGYTNKEDAVMWAYKRGKTERVYYRYFCPFCHYLRESFKGLRSLPNKEDCKFCLWPGEGYVRCEYFSSYYNEWKTARSNALLIPSHKNKNELKKAASKMYKFLLTLRPQKENF